MAAKKMPDPNLKGLQEQNNRPKMNRDTCKHALVSKVSSTRTVNVRSNTEQRVRERQRESRIRELIVSPFQAKSPWRLTIIKCRLRE